MQAAEFFSLDKHLEHSLTKLETSHIDFALVCESNKIATHQTISKIEMIKKKHGFSFTCAPHVMIFSICKKYHMILRCVPLAPEDTLVGNTTCFPINLFGIFAGVILRMISPWWVLETCLKWNGMAGSIRCVAVTCDTEVAFTGYMSPFNSS